MAPTSDVSTVTQNIQMVRDSAPGHGMSCSVAGCRRTFKYHLLLGEKQTVTITFHKWIHLQPFRQRPTVSLAQIAVADLGKGRTDARCPVWSCSAVRWNPRLPNFAHARTWLQHRLMTSHFQNQVCAPPSEKSWIRHWIVSENMPLLF